MVYRDTPRVYWATRLTSGKFFLTAALMGTAGVLTLLACFKAAVLGASLLPLKDVATALILVLPAAVIAKLACEARIHRHLDDQEANPLKKAALLLRGELRMAHTLRFNAALLGGFLLPLFWLYRGYTGTGSGDAAFAIAALILLLAGECMERYLFFTACVPPRMPGA